MYLEKARNVIKTLDPKLNPASAEIMLLRKQLAEKERRIEILENLYTRLVCACYHHLSRQCHGYEMHRQSARLKKYIALLSSNSNVQLSPSMTCCLSLQNRTSHHV